MACKASMEDLEVRRLLSVATIGLNLDPMYDWGTIAPFDDLGTQFRTWGQPATPYAQEAAKRLVEISNIFRGEFGEARLAAQVRPEFGSQAANSYFAQSGLDYVNQRFGNPKNFIVGLAIGDYVGDADSMSSIDDASLTLDGLFAWMNNFIDACRIDRWRTWGDNPN